MHSNEIVLTGRYGEYSKENVFYLKGFFICSIDGKNKTDNFKYIDIPKKVSFVHEKQYNARWRQENYRYPASIFNQDGSFVLFYEFTYQIPVSGNVKALQNHVLFKLNIKEGLVWAKSLPKWEEEDIYLHSTPYMTTENNLRFFKKNKKYYIIDAKHSGNQDKKILYFDSYTGKHVSHIRAYSIDEEGNSKKHTFEVKEDIDMYFNPKYSAVIDENNILFEGNNKKGELLIKVPLK
jgi:hypothetical protein